jgi:hypothetical protein
VGVVAGIVYLKVNINKFIIYIYILKKTYPVAGSQAPAAVVRGAGGSRTRSHRSLPVNRI